MLALYFDGSHCRVRNFPNPEVQKDEALIRVRLAGVCATDLEIVQGYMNFQGILGHEFVGEVEGPQGHPLLGQRVVGEINCGCGDCAACQSGLERHCPNRNVLGILGRNGAFAEYLTLPTRNLHLVPNEVVDEAAVFCEPLAACFEVLEQRADLIGKSALILGDGRLGLLQAQVLRASGAEVVVLGKYPRKLALLDGLGIQTSTDLKEICSISEKWPVVVEATGTAEGFELGLTLTAPQGTMVLKSTVAAASMVHLAPLVIDEITVLGSRCGVFPPALEALAKGHIRVFPLIDERFKLSEANQALERAGKKGTLKVLIAP